MLLYADEDFSHDVVAALQRRGHDVVTVQDEYLCGSSDDEILARAHSLGRAVLTMNRRHYHRLHRLGADHSGIVTATYDSDVEALAARIDVALASQSPGQRWAVRVNRPA